MSAENESLQALAQRVAEAAEGTAEREALLRRLAEQVRSGQYEVDADALAAILLKQMPETEAAAADEGPNSQK